MIDIENDLTDDISNAEVPVNEESEALHRAENDGEAAHTEEADGSSDDACNSSDAVYGDASASEKKKNFISKTNKENKNEKKLFEQIDEQKKTIDELKDRYLRVSADFDNFRKRTAKENETRYLDIKADVLKDFLPVIDNFERARTHGGDEDARKYTEGYELIYTMLMDILNKNGVEEIDALGKQFDPNLHNAVMHVDDETLGEGIVAEVFQKGYRMGDRVLRYSMVKVAN